MACVPRPVTEHQAEDAVLLRLQSFSIEDSRTVQELRREAEAAPSNTDVQIAFALALHQAGCTYEAASILRPLRGHWKKSQGSELAGAAIAAQGWWNKNWKQFVQLRQANRDDAALALLGDRVVHYWDLPPVLFHLGEIAAGRDQSDFANHLFHRVAFLAERGLPKMNMEAFRYVSQAALVDVMYRSGQFAAALDRHGAIIPNPGNAMGHQIQHAKLLVAAGRVEDAMRIAASILVTANKHRTGYSRVLRQEFIETSPDLRPLRKRADWTTMLHDPVAYLRGTQR